MPLSAIILVSTATRASVLQERGPNGEAGQSDRQLHDASVHVVEALPECIVYEKRVAYHATVTDIDSLDRLVAILDVRGAPHSPWVVGVWDIDTGLQYGYMWDDQGAVVANPDVDPAYPFNIAQYAGMLADIVTRDEAGNILTSARPTEAQARAIHVNSFYNNAKRDLA